MNKTKIPFMKMTGSGNDFILIDNRQMLIPPEKAAEFARKACRPKLSLGADGLILIENDKEADFSWRFFNSDGSEAEMCGNGARCAARFAALKDIVKSSSMVFRTGAGLIKAEITGSTQVKVQIPKASEIKLHVSVSLDGFDGATSLETDQNRLVVHFSNTGVPHVVIFCKSRDELDRMDVVKLGRFIRFHPQFSPRGTNVNFVWVASEKEVFIRTYERGVEDETLACGTGSIAAAIISSALGRTHSPVAVNTKGGETLRVFFSKEADNFTEVFLEGQALVVCEGLLWDETLVN